MKVGRKKERKKEEDRKVLYKLLLTQAKNSKEPNSTALYNI